MTAIEHADALDWLARQEPGAARAIVFDPPYSRHSPMRGREDGAAGSVSAPFSFMHRVMGLCAKAVQPKGIVIAFATGNCCPTSGTWPRYRGCGSIHTWPGSAAAREAAACSGERATRS